MIFDCFIFSDELDLLELRLCELDRIVDFFVIVEATMTFSGKPKPLTFADNAHLFEEWRGKIIHVVVNDMPNHPNPWVREGYQRDAIIRGLRGAHDVDSVMISDVDEIPSVSAICKWTAPMGPHAFKQIFSYYWLNCVGSTWAGSRILSFGQLRTFPGPNAVRSARLPHLPDGGWHFSYIGGRERMVKKIEAYSHQELNQDKFKENKYLSIVMGIGMDLFGRPGMDFKFCPIDDRFPEALQRQPERFAHLCSGAMFHENWYSNNAVINVVNTYWQVRGLQGLIVELGCWEGKSTIGLANACYPEPLIAVDTWTGNLAESPTHISVRLARERDVFAQLKTNVVHLTSGNVAVNRQDAVNFLSHLQAPIKFVHVNTGHDYGTVKRVIELCLPWVTSGGVLCGKDFESANCRREDLNGGVERAVREVVPGFVASGDFWRWQKP